MFRCSIFHKAYLTCLLLLLCAGCGTFIAERGLWRIDDQKELPPVFTLREISRYHLPFLENSQYFDMIWDGKNLLIGTYESKVYRINTGDSARVENIYNLEIGKISAMGWDGSHMWVATMGDGKIVRFNQLGDIFVVERIFNVEGADTYPYAMAIDREDLYTGGYSKSLMHYKIKGSDEIVKADEINLEMRLQALAIVEGRIFLVDTIRNKFVEIVDGKIKHFPMENFQQSIGGLAYDGQYFWTLNTDGLIKYKVLEASEKRKKEVSNVITDSQINMESYVYPPGRPVGVAWDGNTIWTMSSAGVNRGFYSHSMDTYLSITGDFLLEGAKVNITHGYGSFAWDGEYFLTIGSKQVDFNKGEVYLVRFHPVTQGDSLKLKVEGIERLFLGDRKSIDALTWIDGHLWVSSGQHTRVSGEGSFIYKMQRNHEGDWEIAETFKAPGARCQGLAWDGENLWSYDTFNDAFYKHRMDDNLTVLKAYGSVQGHTLDYFSGMTWDGKNYWAGNYSFDRIYKITFK